MAEMTEALAKAIICDTLIKMNAIKGRWASLAEVRIACGLSRADFDQAANTLAYAGTVVFAPEDNQKTLSSLDYIASYKVGGVECHLVYLELVD